MTASSLIEMEAKQWLDNTPGVYYHDACYEDAAKSLAKFVATARAREGWQPIETAPKDGRSIVVYGQFAGEINGPSPDMVVGIANWAYAGNTDYEGFNWRADNTDAYAGWWKPTHWQPLPALPSTPERG